jgi:hypothetical protein
VFGAYLLGFLMVYPIVLLVPYAGLLVLPAPFLMAAPAQAEFNEAAASES